MSCKMAVAPMEFSFRHNAPAKIQNFFQTPTFFSVFFCFQLQFAAQVSCFSQPRVIGFFVHFFVDSELFAKFAGEI